MSDPPSPDWWPPPLGCVATVAAAGAAMGALVLARWADCSPVSGCSADYPRDRLIAFGVAGLLAIGIAVGMRRALVRSPARAVLWIVVAMIAAKLLMLAARAAHIRG